jgi:hypothetical protein
MTAAATKTATPVATRDALPYVASLPDRDHTPRVSATRPLALVGALFGASPFLGAFYSLGRWGLLAIAAELAAAALLMTRRVTLDRWSTLALGGLVALALLSLASVGWADSSDASITAGCRWGLYAALFAAALATRPSRREPTWFFAGCCAGALVVAAVVYGQLLTGGAMEELFQRGRLYEPLGYANGLALCLLIPIWPLVALAATPASAVVRGGAISAATLLAALVVLAQSRGVAVAVAVAVAVLLVCGGHRTLRAWAIGAVAVGVLVALPRLLAVYSHASGLEKVVRATDARAAALAALASAVVVGALWAVGCALAGHLREPARERARRIGRIVPFVVLLGALASTPLIVREASRQWRTFVQADRPQTGTASRFTAAGSQRREYWRVALVELRERPLLGWGAGNYSARWFALRRSEEDVRQPHSLELQTLAELGVVGGVALLSVLLGCVGGLAAALRRHGPRPALTATAAVFAAWLAATSVDWIALLPGVTGAVLVATALAAATGARSMPTVAPTRGRRAATAAAVAAMLLLAVLTGRLVLADRWATQAESALADGRPAQALTDARKAEALNSGMLRALYVQAAALARGDRYVDARAVLLRAATRSPRDFLPHALLGDLGVRHGALRVARAEYAAALRRNPRDPMLAAAARDLPPSGSGR